MSEPEQPHRHHGIHDIVGRITEHHEQAARRREDEALAEAVATEAFDLGTDIARPAPGHQPVGYDIEADLGIGEESSDPRR